MTAMDRRRTIERLLAAEGELGLSALAARFKVSEMTIRRDLEALEVQGVLRRVVGGGAIGVTRKAEEPTFVTRALQESQGKAHIGQAVASRLCSGEAIYLDGGSTALAVAHALRETEVKLTVITRNLLAALELGDQQHTDVIILGGRLKPTEMLTVGSSLEHDLRNYNVDTYVMGISGVHPTRGLTDYDPEEAAGKRIALESADRVILALDKTKLGRVLLAHVADLDRVDVVVTDADPSSPAIAAFPPTTEIDFVDGSDPD
jgi:DeoR/GlpR family transcriptional regulator of sugar metabolism